MKFIDAGRTLWRGTTNFWYADGSRYGAATAFYAIFSLAPILVIAVSIVALMLEADPAREGVVGQFAKVVGAQGAEAVDALLARPENDTERGILAAVIAAITLIIGATGVFSELRDALNRMIDARPRKENVVLAFVRVRVVAFSLVLALGFLALSSLLVSSALEAMSERLAPAFGAWLILFKFASITISLGAVTLVCAAIYRWLPDERLPWRALLSGAAVSAILFSLGKWGIGVYLGGSSTTSAYGAAGSFVVLIIWVYFTAQAFLLGASIASAFAGRTPAPGDIVVVEPTSSPEPSR
ncbi:MAG: YihY/virulence factor BrkB family protein [Proteobacteria bacterium]|nr:YihY/virulence factor BrkB family protein [Burkholderiales bacterium]